MIEMSDMALFLSIFAIGYLFMYVFWLNSRIIKLRNQNDTQQLQLIAHTGKIAELKIALDSVNREVRDIQAGLEPTKLPDEIREIISL